VSRWNRNNMIFLTSVVATLAVGALAAPQDSIQSPSTSYNNASAAAWHAMPLCKGFSIEDVTIDGLQQYMASSNLSSVQLLSCYMQRYYQTNQYIK
jgi:amidase